MPNLWIVFLTGLTTGGLSCLAVQGGLLANFVAGRAEEETESASQKVDLHNMTKQQLLSYYENQAQIKRQVRMNGGAAGSVGLFLFAKVVAYTILGFLLGWLGTTLQLTPVFRGILMLLIAVFMVGTALRMMNVHPFFNYFIIQPPRIFSKLIRRVSKKNQASIATPTFLGALTVLIPCGVTQVMMAVALGTGNPLQGALVMLAFTLGTTPVFFILGYLAAKLGESLNTSVMKVAGALILLLALFSLEGGLNLVGSPISYARVKERLGESTEQVSDATPAPTSKQPDTPKALKPEPADPPLTDQDSPTKLGLTVDDDNGYSPSVLYATANKPVELTLQVNNAYSCVRAFTVPSLKIQTILPEKGSKTINIPAQQKGTLRYSCSMGMYTGKIVFQ